MWLKALDIGVWGRIPFNEKISIPDFIKRRAKGELDLIDGQLYELTRYKHQPVQFQIRRKDEVVMTFAAMAGGFLIWKSVPGQAIYFKRKSDFNIKTIPEDANYWHTEQWR